MLEIIRKCDQILGLKNAMRMLKIGYQIYPLSNPLINLSNVFNEFKRLCKSLFS